jgi:hypothetical protein
MSGMKGPNFRNKPNFKRDNNNESVEFATNGEKYGCKGEYRTFKVQAFRFSDNAYCETFLTLLS